MVRMAKISIDKLLSRGANVATFWPFIPAGVLGVIGGYLAAGVGWIKAFGAFGLFVSGLSVFLLSAVAFAVIAKTKLWRIEARYRSMAIGNSSPFDPMATIYENKRLYVRDLAPLGREVVARKKFVRCEIIGPGNILIGLRENDKSPFPQVKDNLFGQDCNFIEIDTASTPKNTVAFAACDFDGCSFWGLNLLWLERHNPTWNWITRPSTQPLLDLKANELEQPGTVQSTPEINDSGGAPQG
jgi:hypothetical protein